MQEISKLEEECSSQRMTKENLEEQVALFVKTVPRLAQSLAEERNLNVKRDEEIVQLRSCIDDLKKQNERLSDLVDSNEEKSKLDNLTSN